jgi:hypothetical protein
MKNRSTVFAFAIIVLLCAATLPGCTDPKAKAAGTYEVDKAAIKAAAEAEIKAKGENDPDSMGAAMMLGMIDAMVMTMTLNVDGTAKMQTSVMGQTDTESGTFTISGKTITIRVASEGESAEPLTGTISDDTITLNPPKDQEMPFDLVFRKKKN